MAQDIAGGFGMTHGKTQHLMYDVWASESVLETCLLLEASLTSHARLALSLCFCYSS